LSRHPDIIVVTLNPAIDRTVEVDQMRLGGVVRCRLTLVEPAGKGINVALDLAALGCRAVAIGFVGRQEAAMFRRAFAGTPVQTDFTLVEGSTRVSLTILDRGASQETHLAEQGFEVSRQAARRLIAKTRALARPGAWVCFNGRPAPGFGLEAYAELLATAKAAGARLLVDTSGDYLPAALEAKPDFVKPNEEELAELAGRPLPTPRAVVRAARQVAQKAAHVVVSLGGRGALAVTPQGAWRAKERVRARVVHTVGCGDALATGYLAGLASGLPAPEALRLGVACGGACARTPRAALRSMAEVEAVRPNVDVTPFAL